MKKSKTGNKTKVPFEKIGRINMTMAKKIGSRCSDIYIDVNNLHLQKHKKEIETIGFSVFEYARYIGKNFNQIRAGKDNSYLIVSYNDKTSHVAAIKLNYIIKKGVWMVASIHPKSKKEIDKFDLLWHKK